MSTRILRKRLLLNYPFAVFADERRLPRTARPRHADACPTDPADQSLQFGCDKSRDPVGTVVDIAEPGAADDGVCGPEPALAFGVYERASLR